MAKTIAEQLTDALAKISTLETDAASHVSTLAAVTEKAASDLATIQTENTNLKTEISDLKTAQAGLFTQEQVEAQVKAKAAKISIAAIAATGADPVNANPSSKADAPKTFKEVVKMKVAAGEKKTDAIRAGIKEFPELYKVALENGETATL